jgi:hypothetical protein
MQQANVFCRFNEKSMAVFFRLANTVDRRTLARNLPSVVTGLHKYGWDFLITSPLPLCSLYRQSKVVCIVPPIHPVDMGGQVAAMFRVRGRRWTGHQASPFCFSCSLHPPTESFPCPLFLIPLPVTSTGECGLERPQPTSCQWAIERGGELSKTQHFFC